MLNTYHNNIPYGCPARPVKFTELKKVKLSCGEWVDVLTANREFFERIRCGCENCKVFWADICPCIEFGDVRRVFLSDDGFKKCGCDINDVVDIEEGEEFVGDNCDGILKPKKLIALRTQWSGFDVHADQIQPYSGSHKLVKMMAAYDPRNLHVNILSPIMPRHRKCDCNELFIYNELGY